MLKELIESGYGYEPDNYENGYNCAEKILYGANEVYSLGLDLNGRHVACAFGGGLFVGSACGGVCGAAMVLGCLGVKDTQHRTDGFKEKVETFFRTVENQEGSLLCKDLRPIYGEEKKCMPLLVKLAAMLDEYYLELQDERNE